MLRKKPKEEPSSNASRTFNQTEHSFISMPNQNFRYPQSPIFIPYPVYQLQQFQGESQGHDITPRRFEQSIEVKSSPAIKTVETSEMAIIETTERVETERKN